MSLLELSETQLSDWLAAHGYPRYRASQIRGGLFRNRVGSWEEMSDLPKEMRARLGGSFPLYGTRVAAHRCAADGTQKLLLTLAAGGQVECVLLPDGPRRSICISTQVGCAMGCVFCASGLSGVERNLAAGEILEQALQLQRLLPRDERLTHMVVMGMGEPLANLDGLLPALEEVRRDDGLGISVRRITISTVGIPSAIRRLARGVPHYHLAVSLHAPTDELRNRLVPTNRKSGLAELLRAADEYFQASGRRLTYEYVLLAGINDQSQHARGLVQLLRDRPVLLNVIPFNPVAGLPYSTPDAAAIRRFRRVLLDGQVNVQFRQRRGDDIDAACGQLRRATTGR
ncbi:MAG: 23S rRNA (adenine(2503)-C(2))-methyltransferase RlmN [Planctomycetes bacterium]|nr:23S rRNA (adenine(2503)-C(2))-methyltransferase RlmN [Planctomycetota bacterium]